MQLHTISDTLLHAMENRIARPLNHLGEDAKLFSDEVDLLELLDEYLDGDDPPGKTPPSTHLKKNINNTSLPPQRIILTQYKNKNY